MMMGKGNSGWERGNWYRELHMGSSLLRATLFLYQRPALRPAYEAQRAEKGERVGLAHSGSIGTRREIL
jgi:hypothetical protein